MQRKEKEYSVGKSVFRLALALLLAALASEFARAGEQGPPLSVGTILPVQVNSAISSAKCKPGQKIRGTVMQEVPLASGERIRKGSKVIGHVVEVGHAASGKPAWISIQFDKLVSDGGTMTIVTNLRAIAGFMEIEEAQTPQIGPGEGDVYNWLTTTQIGGDSVYGVRGTVGASEDASEIVGRAVNDGVLAKVRAKEGTKCRGAVDGNDSPQALWVFSTDACGVYGIEHVSIRHAGRTEPSGVITFAADKGTVKIPRGAGMLLRVRGSTQSYGQSSD